MKYVLKSFYFCTCRERPLLTFLKGGLYKRRHSGNHGTVNWTFSFGLCFEQESWNWKGKETASIWTWLDGARLWVFFYCIAIVHRLLRVTINGKWLSLFRFSMTHSYIHVFQQLNTTHHTILTSCQAIDIYVCIFQTLIDAVCPLLYVLCKCNSDRVVKVRKMADAFYGQYQF